MKHRSVISFVIVAAALFSLPQLSHDLQALKGAVGARLHSELLQAFLNLPAGAPVAADTVARPAETLLASCTQSKSGNEGVKGRKGATAGRAEVRAAEKSLGQSAMIGDPAHDPINQVASVEFEKAAEEVVKSLTDVKVETEVAMIVPPDKVLDPLGIAKARTPDEMARVESDRLRVEANRLRVAYAAAASFQANDPELQKATEDAFRMLNGSLPAGYQFRLVRDGAKTKVLKLRCGQCPSTLPRAPRPAPAAVPLPAPPAPAEWVGE
jgi:hypothetical protein